MARSPDELKNLAITLVQEAERRGASLRLLGGLAFYLVSPSASGNPVLRRDYQDLDFVVDTRGVRSVTEAFVAQGWEPDRHFNALHGATRMLFYYQSELQADVFVGNFVQCHKLALERRLALHPATVTPADLLLTKLQIRQMNAKDAKDIFALLLGIDLVQQSGVTGIDLGYITRLTGEDWGWYTTVHDNLEFLLESLPEGLKPEERAVLHSKLDQLKNAIESAPKTLRWQIRDRVGRRVPWYDEPEEVNR